MTNTHLGSTLDITRSCEDYLSTRQGSYEFRCIRYKGVADKLYDMGLDRWDDIVDIGAGRQQFESYMRLERKWEGEYIPIDGSIDGTNLEEWLPGCRYSFMVAIEVLEHLNTWERMMMIMENFTICGAVATVPNPKTVDVLGCDPTHVSVIHEHDFREHNWSVQPVSFFHKPDDTLLAWHKGIFAG